ncbi:MAG TPA: M48 family metallopeptidase [Gemmatimonadales bacterium]|nr:M48 family metallopeptidase [Gemmatimonadales bacterium]
MSGTNLFAQQQANRRRSAVLVTIFVLFFAWIGFGADAILYLNTRGRLDGGYVHAAPVVGLALGLLALGVAWFSWRRGPRQILWASGAWEMVTPSTAEEQQLVNVVEEMAIASGLPKPKIWVVPDDDPNAFATGTDARNAHVAVTRGLLTALNRDELQAVVAHEMAHVRNYDVRLMTLLAALVGVLALVSDGVMRSLRFGGRGGRGVRGGGKKGGGALLLILLVIWLISVLLAPIVSRLLALGVSRKREFLADATGAQFTRNPGALATALQKIEQSAAPTKAIHRGSAHLCIADPLGRRLTNKQGFVADLLATHPPMATRIARLKQMAYQFEKTGELPEMLMP